VLGVIITAAYILRVMGRVFFGEIPVELETTVGDVTVMDKIAIALLSVIMVGLGLFPFLMTPLVQSGVDNVLRLLGGA
jgi:NADH:ubiquinone oxidoreductase subunit 4 (subunit M)